MLNFLSTILDVLTVELIQIGGCLNTMGLNPIKVCMSRNCNSFYSIFYN